MITESQTCAEVLDQDHQRERHLEKAHLDNINAYYDSPAVALFERFAKQQIHLGYWDARYPEVTLNQAARRLTNVVLDYLTVPRNGRVIDIGCGCGIPALTLATERPCYVEGVTINPAQQSKAQAMARNEGMTDRLNFIVADANHLPYENEIFDRALLLESIHHIGHQSALQEAHRVLKPGGEILIADGVVIREDAKSEYVDRLGEIFVANSLMTARQIEHTMMETGFMASKIINITAAVQPTWQKLIKETDANKEAIVAEMGTAFFAELMAFWDDINQLWSGSAEYLLIKGRKR